MNMGQYQGGIQRILSKNVYYEKWSDKKLIEYQVKLKGQSYLNTKWMRQQEIGRRLIDEYEKSKDKNSMSASINNHQQHHQQQSTTPRMIRQHNTNPFSNNNDLKLSIIINSSKLRKQQNHIIYNDRVQQILSQIHHVCERSYVFDNDNDGKKKSCQQKLIKIIEVNLGRFVDGMQKGNNNGQVYSMMSQLKQAQLLKSKKTLIRIWLKVKWQDNTVSKVKMDYLQKYQAQLMQNYKDNRNMYWRKWRVHNNNNNSNSNGKVSNIKHFDQNKKQQEQTNNQQTSESIIAYSMEKNSNGSQEKKMKSNLIDNMQVQEQQQTVTDNNNKPIRQHSFAQRQQPQVGNALRKQLKLTPLERFQAINRTMLETKQNKQQKSKQKQQNKSIMSYFNQIKTKAVNKSPQLSLTSFPQLQSQIAIKPIENVAISSVTTTMNINKHNSIQLSTKKKTINQMVMQQFRSKLLLKNYLSSKPKNSNYIQQQIQVRDGMAVGRKSVWADLSSMIDQKQMKRNADSKEKQYLRQLTGNGIKQQYQEQSPKTFIPMNMRNANKIIPIKKQIQLIVIDDD